MQNKFTSKGKHLDFILLDLICVVVSYYLAILIRFSNLDILGNFKDTDNRYEILYQELFIILILMHLVLVFITDNYSGITRRNNTWEFRAVINHNFELFAGSFIVMFFLKISGDFSRILMLVFIVLDTIFMYLLRYLRKRALFAKSNSPKGKSMMLVVANYDDAVRIIRTLNKMKFRTFWIQGTVILDKNIVGETVEGVPVVCGFGDLFEYVKSNIIDEVFLDYNGKGVNKFINKFVNMGTVVHVNMDHILNGVPNSTVQHFDRCMVVTATVNFMSKKQIVVKRFMDICISIPGVIMTGLFTIIFGPIIYIQSPGPIFFKQTRVGRNGRTFKLYKFRSMYMDAEERKKELMEQNEMSGLMFKMDDDPRIMPIGRFLRKASIDEFPQFINILKGDMSFVGTRPPTWDEYIQYEQHHKSRLAIKPGLTGMWQVSGRSDITDFEEVVRLDNYYIKHFCISLDIKIILKTVIAVIKHKGK